MYDAILAFLTAFTLTYFAIPSIINIAITKNLCDEPGERRSHTTSTPSLGGIAIFGGTLITGTFFIEYNSIPKFNYILCAITLLFFTGVKDDVIPLTPRKKFIAQIISAGILVFKANIRLTSLYGLFALGLNLQWGFTGLINFGHVAFMMITKLLASWAILNRPSLPSLK